MAFTVPGRPDFPAGVHLSVEMTKNWLCVSTPTVYKLIDRGELRSFKIGRRRLIDGNSVVEYVARQMREAA